MQNWQQTLISEFAASPTLNALLEGFNQQLDQQPSFDAFYSHIWNVATADAYGLDVWGRIVGVSRVLKVAASAYFGFEQGGNLTDTGFGPANTNPFYIGQPTTSNYALTDAAFRTLIYAKALANISDLSISSINSVLRILFAGRGDAFCTDGGDMTMTYSFAFALTAVEYSIIANSGVVPKPAGVSLTIDQGVA